MRQYAAVAFTADLAAVAQRLLPLMMRNIASDGFRFADPLNPGVFSAAGCVIASPSYPRNQDDVTQNYVFNWTRDAAIVAIEIAAAGGYGDTLAGGVLFAATCQASTATLAQACFTIDGRPRTGWALQNDGPALRAIAVLRAYEQLDAETRKIARSVLAADVAFVLAAYRDSSYNLWEEVVGQSFFTRSSQLKCLLAVASSDLGIPVVPDAIAWLRSSLDEHWNGHHIVSILDATSARPGYDPNIDIVSACVYGAIAPDDPRLLATAALLREQWSDPSSPVAYGINADDAAVGVGPMLGRYPGDVYDGDHDDSGLDHPWPVATANFAELFYRLAALIAASGTVGVTELSSPFFAQVAVNASTTTDDATAALVAAGDAMLHAIVRHSDHLELSEQVDGATGFQKSVRNLTWSYAAFLSAARARADVIGR